jgi:hypothetical protein
MEMADVLLNSQDAQSKKFMIEILRVELTDPKLLSYEFDLSQRDGSFVVKDWRIKFYATSLEFLRCERVGEVDDEVPVVVPEIINHLKTKQQDLFEKATKGHMLATSSTDTSVMLDLLALGLVPIKRIVSPERVRTSLTYNSSSRSPRQEYEMLYSSVAESAHTVGFVMGVTFASSAESAFDVKSSFIFLVSKKKQLIALAKFAYPYAPLKAIVEIDRLGSLYPGGCKKLCGLLSQKFLEERTKTVVIESINNAAHMCYLKSFLAPTGYKYAMLMRSAAHSFGALVDPSTLDIWLTRYGGTGDTSKIELYSTVHMIYMHDGSVLANINTTGMYERWFSLRTSTLEVYCEVNDDVEKAIDNFVNYGTDTHKMDWKPRVFIIHRASEYRARHLIGRDVRHEVESINTFD